MRHHLTPLRMAIIKQQKIVSIGEDVKKLEPLCMATGNVKLCIHYVKQYDSSTKKLNIELPYDPEILLLGIYPKELKAGTWTDICIPMFITVLFIIVKRWKQLKYPLTNEWIRTSLVVQWLRLHAPKAGGMGSIPGRGTRISHVTWWGQKKKRIDKQNVGYSYNGILFSLKKEGNSDMCYSMNEPAWL